jgi:hypothetical protein
LLCGELSFEQPRHPEARSPEPTGSCNWISPRSSAIPYRQRPRTSTRRRFRSISPSAVSTIERAIPSNRFLTNSTQIDRGARFLVASAGEYCQPVASGTCVVDIAATVVDRGLRVSTNRRAEWSAFLPTDRRPAWRTRVSLYDEADHSIGGDRSTPHLHLEAGNIREMLDIVGDQRHPLRYRV